MLSSSSTIRIFSPATGPSSPLGLRRVRDGACRALGLGQPQAHRGAHSDPTLDFQVSAMAFHDPTGDGQAETGAALLRGKERIEYVLEVFGLDARAGVDDLEHRARRGLGPSPAVRRSPVLAHRYRDRSLLFDRLEGVDQEIRQDLLHLVQIRLDPDLRPGRLERDALGARRTRMAPGQLHRLAREGRGVHGLRAKRTLARVIEELSDEPVESLRLAHDEIEQPRVLAFHLELALENLDRSRDGVQTVPDLVRDAGGELADRHQGLAATDLLLQRLYLGEVLEERDHSAPLARAPEEEARRHPQRDRAPVRRAYRHFVARPLHPLLERLPEPRCERFESLPEHLDVVTPPHCARRDPEDLARRTVPVAHQSP